MEPQEWYRLDTDSNNPYSLTDSPIREDGGRLSYHEKDGMPCTIKVGKKPMLDLADTLRGFLLFSKRAREVLLSLRLQEGIVWTPVNIRYRDKKIDRVPSHSCATYAAFLVRKPTGIA